MEAGCGERNDFMSEKICYWIYPWLTVRDQASSCSLAEGLAINLRLTLVIDQGNYVELPLIKLDKLVMLVRLLF